MLFMRVLCGVRCRGATLATPRHSGWAVIGWVRERTICSPRIWICVGGLSSHWCAPPTPGPMGKVKRGASTMEAHCCCHFHSLLLLLSPEAFLKPQSGREDLKQYCYISKCNSALSFPSRRTSLLPHPTEKGKLL